MKLTFKKLSGEVSTKEICFSTPISKSINRQKDLFYFIDLNDKKVMLQAVSIFTKATYWTAEEMLPILIDVAKTSLRILKLDAV